MITIDLETDRVELGGALRGRVQARPEPGQKTPRALVFEVGWRTEGRGNKDTGVLVSERRPPSSDPPAWDEPFEVTLPAEGPPSYDGRVLRILWEVRVSLDTAWAADEQAVRSFQVVVGP